MITRQTTKANQKLIEEPLVTIVEPLVTDSDDDLVIMTEVFKLPTLDRKTKKKKYCLKSERMNLQVTYL